MALSRQGTAGVELLLAAVGAELGDDDGEEECGLERGGPCLAQPSAVDFAAPPTSYVAGPLHRRKSRPQRSRLDSMAAPPPDPKAIKAKGGRKQQQQQQQAERQESPGGEEEDSEPVAAPKRLGGRRGAAAAEQEEDLPLLRGRKRRPERPVLSEAAAAPGSEADALPQRPGRHQTDEQLWQMALGRRTGRLQNLIDAVGDLQGDAKHGPLMQQVSWRAKLELELGLRALSQEVAAQEAAALAACCPAPAATAAAAAAAIKSEPSSGGAALEAVAPGSFAAMLIDDAPEEAAAAAPQEVPKEEDAAGPAAPLPRRRLGAAAEAAAALLPLGPAGQSSLLMSDGASVSQDLLQRLPTLDTVRRLRSVAMLTAAIQQQQQQQPGAWGLAPQAMLPNTQLCASRCIVTGATPQVLQMSRVNSSPFDPASAPSLFC
jgi:hypothetical protein